MRVAWFTPLSERSAIAEYSLWVTSALAELCDVELWVSGTADARATDLPVIDFGSLPSLADSLSDYDVCFYNLGNHNRYHGAIYEVSQRHPGLVVLHDRVLHHFFFTHWLAIGRNDLYIDALDRHYGVEARRSAEDSFAGNRPPMWEDDETVYRFPLFEEALVGARGAVVHSRDHAAAVEERWFGPVAPLFLPAYPLAEGDATALPADLRPDGRTMLVTVGHVNRNKQIHRVIQALASARLRDRARYLVVGPHDPEARYGRELGALIERLGLEDTVQLTGYQPDEVVGALVRTADALVNLRYPAFEGGSASLMQGLALGKPTLVYKTAGFAELPDAAVVKVRPGDDRGLTDALERLVTSPDLRAATGEGARSAAAERSPASYAHALVEFAEDARYWEPAMTLCDRVAEELAALGVDSTLPAVDVIAHETSLILADEPPSVAEAVSFREIGPGDVAGLSRFFTRNDIPAVVGTFDPFSFTQKTAREIAVEPGRDRYYGAFLGERLVGLSMLRGWNEGYEVPSFGIAVDVDFHGRGVGTRMTNWTVEQARKLGCGQVRLSVYGRNEGAHRIYERLGFRELERSPVERNGAVDERIIMVKELA